MHQIYKLAPQFSIHQQIYCAPIYSSVPQFTEPTSPEITMARPVKQLANTRNYTRWISQQVGDLLPKITAYYRAAPCFALQISITIEHLESIKVVHLKCYKLRLV